MEINLPALNRTKRNELVILILCLLTGFVLRFYTFDQKSLWLDEIYTFNDAKYGLNDQLKFYKEKPNYLHPPLFFILTHLSYPFTKPERDIRLVPLIFGVLSIPMIYFLSGLFSAAIAVPCTISLTFMAYHISLSQEGRSYSLLMFLGMAGLYFFMKHLKTSKKVYLIGVALLFATLFHTSYSSIPFIALSQILWFYQINEDHKKPVFSSFLILNGLTLLMCLPWILFIGLNYRGQPFTIPLRQGLAPLWSILYGVFHDWVPHAPLMIVSMILFILFPILPNFRKNALVLLAAFILPIGGLYLYCRLFNATHFITSRYFINLLPLFFITLYLSLAATEDKFKRLKRFMRLKPLFIILFIASNLAILPFYYRSEKQDYKGLVTYLKGQLKGGDKIAVGTELYIPGMLHYLGVYPEGRLYLLPSRKVSEKEIESQITLVMRDKIFTIFYSKAEWARCMNEGNRLWVVVNKITAERIKEDSSYVLKGYFDGSFLNFNRFPVDASIYLFLRDPQSPNEKGIDMPIE
jgi:hypothetical protein